MILKFYFIVLTLSQVQDGFAFFFWWCLFLVCGFVFVLVWFFWCCFFFLFKKKKMLILTGFQQICAIQRLLYLGCGCPSPLGCSLEHRGWLMGVVMGAVVQHDVALVQLLVTSMGWGA